MLRYQLATIGIRIELTCQDIELVPFANLLVGETEAQCIAGIALFFTEHIDQFSEAVLGTTDMLVRRQVDLAFKAHPPPAPLSVVLATVSQLLCDSVRVTAVTGPQEIGYPRGFNLPGIIVNQLCQGLQGASLPQILVWTPPRLSARKGTAHNRARMAREQAGLTQEQAVTQLGLVGPAALLAWESVPDLGEADRLDMARGRASMVAAMSRLYRISPEWLRGEVPV